MKFYLVIYLLCLAGTLAAQTNPEGSPSNGPPFENGAPSSEIAPGLVKEQPKRRGLEGLPSSEEGSPAPSAEDQDSEGEAKSGLERSSPIPPYPNYPQSVLPKPPRTPRQQEYLYLNHIYFDPLFLSIGGFVSFGWLAMISSGKALDVGLNIYSARTNLSIVLAQKQDDEDYSGVVGLLLRLGLHFFTEPNQLKGFDFGIISRTGIIITPVSGNAVILQESLELAFAYRFVVSFFSRNGRPALSLGIAPYVTFSISAYFPTSGTIAALRSGDPGFEEYINAGNLITEPGVINEIDPLAMKLSFRFGLELSIIF